MEARADGGREHSATGELDEGDAAAFLEVSPALMAVTDLTTVVVAASRSWRGLGWEPSDLVGRRLMELIHPDEVGAAEALLARLQGGEDVGEIDVRLLHNDGGYRWFQGNGRVDLRAERLYFSGVDITARKELEARLRRQLALEELVASLATRLIGTDPEDVVSAIRHGVEELARAMGADRGHFLRGSRRDLDAAAYVEWRDPDTTSEAHRPTDDPEVQAWWRRQMRAGRLLLLDEVEQLQDEAPDVVAALRADGVRSLVHVPLPSLRGRWGFLTMSAVREPVVFGSHASSLLRLAGECFMTALAQRDDALALEDARAELQRRNEALERSNEGLEGFAYAAAHDLKAPLARVEMALSATPSVGSPTDELLGIARRATSRMRQLIEDLLTFAAAGSAVGPPSTVDLDYLLTQVLSDLEPLITAGGVVVERSRLPSVPGYRALLGQLLQNLLANSIKFTVPGRAPRIWIDAQDVDGGVQVTVRDNGIGIAPEHREAVFGVFTRLNAEDSYTGSGIGLATCARVVQHHGGRMWVEDGVDGGTAVCVWLPQSSGEVPAGAGNER
jgi:PAS domain S-box-containing protein